MAESTIIYPEATSGSSVPVWMAMNNGGLFGNNGWGGGILGFLLCLFFGNGWGGFGGFGASANTMKEALELMEDGGYNTGFTFTNPVEHLAIIAVGPTTSGKEFQNTLVHEVHHLAVAIADELGIDLEAETPAYIAGDAIMDLADVICKMGCQSCSKRNKKN